MAVYASGESVPDICERISRGLEPLSEWAKANGVEFNFAKCGATVLTRKQQVPTPVVQFQGKSLTHMPQVKYLGVHLDQKLSWKHHLTELNKRAARKLEYLLSLCSKVRGPPLDKILLIYKTFVRPLLDYACPIWDDASVAVKTSLVDSIQHHLLARALGVRYKCARGALEVEANVAPLSERRLFLTARAFKRYSVSRNSVRQLIEEHRAGTATVLLGTHNISFILRGDRLCDNSFRSSNTKQSHIARWQRSWDTNPDGRAFYAIQPVVSLKQSKKFQGLPRYLIAAIVGMRVHQSSLNADLNQCALIPSPNCACGQPETVEHYLTGCPNYASQRAPLQTAVAAAGVTFSASTILSIGFGTHPSSRQLRKELLKYIIATRRFSA